MHDPFVVDANTVGETLFLVYRWIRQILGNNRVNVAEATQGEQGEREDG